MSVAFLTLMADIAEKNGSRRHHQMTTKDDVRLVDSDDYERSSSPSLAARRRRDLIKASAIAAVAVAIALAVVSVEIPRELLSDAGSLFSTLLTTRDGKVEETSTVQPSAEMQSDVARRASALVDAADQGQTEIAQVSTEEWLARFQAWATLDNAQPAPMQPVQEAQVQPAADPIQSVGPVQNARAEIETATPHRSTRHVKHAVSELRRKRDQERAHRTATLAAATKRVASGAVLNR
jgi:hypothetical protein